MKLSDFVVMQEGKLAKELDFVSHHVRTKLDELKRQEVNRLRTLIKAKQDLEGGNGTTLPTKSNMSTCVRGRNTHMLLLQ